ncbi:FdxN element excision controlling factor protein [Nostoc sp. NIES-3756]|uniref:XisH family protein n=1 Tax=Nostoc sp. NIES-3756 TaxID=1751286 RepID=UPI00071EC380|nr:XisH family protein [Nostoc sp. NIES-3756]BAT52675.1 FdxN element excision controlling factor protein [Nostoc sp. NIES-3756]BAY39636.1 fdxN element excision controlling factor protein [Nostoc sp. NIES-2111]
MSAKDKFHDIVKIGLEKDGWKITDDPLRIEWGLVELYIDLGAEKIIAAEKQGQKIAVEVKSFLGQSTISEFHTALGQFINYRFAISQKQPERILYLAVPLDTYETFFQLLFPQTIVQQYQLRLLIYDVINEVIVRWIN